MRWSPEVGHVPRGFCGAARSLDEVQLVLVAAEPGDPRKGEAHKPGGSPAEQLTSAYAYAYECFRSGKDLYHRNVRRILDLCWPGEPFPAQLAKVWITDSVLCSARVEGGPIIPQTALECRRRYLDPQPALFPKAVVAALGRKAQARVRNIPGVIPGFAAAPPGCNFRGARASWEKISEIVRARVA